MLGTHELTFFRARTFRQGGPTAMMLQRVLGRATPATSTRRMTAAAGAGLSKPVAGLSTISTVPHQHKEEEQESPPAGPKVVVLGGNGYVGSHVLQAALNRGADAVSVNRSGEPKHLGGSWVSMVKWVRGDVFDDKAWAAELEGATGVVSCIGAFGSNQFMERINGDANVHAAEVAAKAGVEHFVYVSTVENNLPSFVLKGYFHGKQRAEEAVLDKFPHGKGVVLRPSFVYGTRQVGSMSVPLHLLGKPLEVLFRIPPFPTLRQTLPGTQAILAPPVAVQAVAAVAAAAAMGDARVKAGEGSREGVLSVDDIVRLARVV